MNVLWFALASPFLATAAVAVGGLFGAGKGIGDRTARLPVRTLIIRAVLFALGGAAVSLVGTVLWMAWYERSTGFDAANAPLAWIFFYGPISVAAGQLLALVTWWLHHPAQFNHGANEPN